MTDRLRILYAVLTASGEFTAADLARRTGVNLATVRTVLHRERRYLEEKGRTEMPGRGGRTIRYVLAASERASLEEEFADLRKEFMVPAPEQPPAMMVAAEDLLRRQYEAATTPERKAMLLKAAERALASAEKIVLQQPGTEYSPHLVRLNYLKLVATAHHLPAEVPRIPGAFARRLQFVTASLGNALDRFRHAPEILPSPAFASASSAAVPAGQGILERSETLVDAFHDAKQHAARVFNRSELKLTKEAKLEAANFFRERVQQPVSERMTQSIARSILEDPQPKLPIASLAALGIDPACYEPGVLTIGEAHPADIIVNSWRYNAACEEFNYAASPLQNCVMTG